MSCGLHSSESAVLKTSTMVMSRRMLKRAMFAGISILCDLICEKSMGIRDIYRSVEGREIQRKRKSYSFVTEQVFLFLTHDFNHALDNFM